MNYSVSIACQVFDLLAMPKVNTNDFLTSTYLFVGSWAAPLNVGRKCLGNTQPILQTGVGRSTSLFQPSRRDEDPRYPGPRLATSLCHFSQGLSISDRWPVVSPLLPSECTKVTLSY